MTIGLADYNNLLGLFDKFQNNNKQKKDFGLHDYSLINALLKKNDEVNLHSNFIYSMINPNSSHYCGNNFLKLFLESIGEIGFINLDNARVHKEKGKIDLLIEDGNNLIIIENKLRAVDQRHQISRYIKYVYEKYIENSCHINDRIKVIYLSQYKEMPSSDSESIIGFECSDKSKNLIWKGEEVELCDGAKLNLPTGTELKFIRVKHSKELSQWVDKSIEWLSEYKPNGQGLIYAFNEYELILKRLDTTKRWRKIMSLDEYVLELQEDEQRKMSNFMEEAYKKLNDYKSKKIFEFFEKYPQKRCKIDGKEFKEFTPNNCQNWFKKIGGKDKYRDVGIEIVIGNEKYIFALGVNNIAFGKSTNKFIFSENIISNRDEDVFIIIDKIKNKLPK